MSELPRHSYRRADVLGAVSSREVSEATRKAAGAALAELGVPLTRAEVGRLANRMLDALAEGLHARPHDG